MISHLTGIYDHATKNSITIDVKGVGYHVFVPLSLLNKLPKKGQEIKLYTSQVVREDSISLYGFLSREEKTLFGHLLSVNGIGPKAAIALIGRIPLDKLVAAITKGNVDLIRTIPGIGLKTSQKLVIELKEKLAKEYGVESADLAKGLFGEEPVLKDAISALMALGYRPSEAREAIKKAGIEFSEKVTVEDIIKKALRAAA